MSEPGGRPATSFEERLDASVVEGCRTSVQAPAPRSQPLPGAIKVLPSPTGAYAGLYMNPPSLGSYREFTRQTGKRPPIVFAGQGWVADENFGEDNPPLHTLTERHVEADEDLTSLHFAEELAKDDVLLAFAWGVYCCDVTSQSFLSGLERPWNIFSRILRGDFDDYIRTVARQIRTFERPIMMTLTGEFNSQALFMFGEDGTEWMNEVDNICNQYGDPTWPDGPERIRDTYMHVIDLFRDEGVRNVSWFMYAASNYVSDDPIDDVWVHPQYVYPGDSYIDWVGQSAYFVDTAADHGIDGARDLRGALRAGYEAWGTVTERPIFLPEFGAMSDGDASRAGLLRQVFGDVLPGFPRVKAVAFGDSELFAAYFLLPRLGTFADEAAAWRQMVSDNPYYLDRVAFGPWTP